MKPFFLMNFFLLLGFLNSAYSDDEKPHHPYLYHLEVNGQSSYLLGTMHSRQIRVDDFNPFLVELIKESDYLAVESIPEQGGFMPSFERPGDSRFFNSNEHNTWFDEISFVAMSKLLKFIEKTTSNKKEYENVLSYLKSLKVGAAYTLVFDMITEVSVQQKSTEPSLLDQSNQSSSLMEVFDNQLVSVARESKTPVAVVDDASVFYDIGIKTFTVEDFNDLMSKSVEESGDLVSSYVVDVSESLGPSSQNDDSVRSYIDGSFERSLLGRVDSWDSEDVGHRWHKTVLSRHLEWTELMISKMRNKSFFFAVGLAHVQRISDGKEFSDVPRLLELFERKGVKITKIDSNTESYVRSRSDVGAFTEVLSCKSLL